MGKRRVFISYHHKDEQAVVDNFIGTFGQDFDFVTDQSPDRPSDSEDVEQLSQVCRDAIDGTTVTIVVIGTQTAGRRFVDWEIWHTLHREHGLIGIARPRLPNTQASLPDRLVDNLDSGYAAWYAYPHSASALEGMIDKAYESDTEKINNSREMMKKKTSE